MHDRVERARQDSDTALFYDLMLEAECLLKLTTCAVIALLDEDRSRSVYALEHRLVRADGLGDWVAVLRDAVKGSQARLVVPAGTEHLRQLSQLMGRTEWQFDAVAKLDDALRVLLPVRDELPGKTDLLRFFELFAQLRNATKAHGATAPATCARLVQPVSQAIAVVEEHLQILGGEWAYLHRNLSGKYRVTAVSAGADAFAYLKNSRADSYRDGVYMWADGPRYVPLVDSDADLTDYFLPNGAFTDRTYEMLSYVTDDRRRCDSTPYLLPVGELPESETQGRGLLDVVGCAFTNIPSDQSPYVSRRLLETDVFDRLLDDQHPLITMAGRGGVGKTSLAIRVLHEVVETSRYETVLWFSARDIDLLPSGPKPVQPRVLSEDDVARECVRLVEPRERREKGFKAREYFERCLQKPELGPTLFVFDNFETVRSPQALFKWLHAHLRLPNKVLITTRFRDFNADYRVEVGGMTREECEELIDITSGRLGIARLIDQEYRDELYAEADGHPYVVKILLGRVAREGKAAKIERVLAAEDDVLEALFERTFTLLTPAAKRVFLLLASWRSAVPEVAVESILLRPANERMNVKEAVDELIRSSLVETRVAEADEGTFLILPLAAMLYGRRMLSVSPLKAAVEADKELLLLFGAASDYEVQLGLRPRVDRFVQSIAGRLERGDGVFEDYEPVLRFLARRYPPAWIGVADMLEERGGKEYWLKAVEAIQFFLQDASDEDAQAMGWERLEYLGRRLGDLQLELSAIVERASLPGVSRDVVSRAANRVNAILSEEPYAVDRDERRILVRSLIGVFEKRLDEMDATDLSRLAWLYLRLRDVKSAERIVQLGMQDDASNQHLRRLSKKLQETI